MMMTTFSPVYRRLRPLLLAPLLLCGCFPRAEPDPWRNMPKRRMPWIGAPFRAGLGGKPFGIKRSELRKMHARGAGAFIRQVSLHPVMDRNRRFIGFSIERMFWNAPGFPKIGIKVGDIVLKVTGLSIARPEQFMQVWNELPKIPELVIEYLRQGRRHILRIPILGR